MKSAIAILALLVCTLTACGGADKNANHTPDSTTTTTTTPRTTTVVAATSGTGVVHPEQSWVRRQHADPGGVFLQRPQRPSAASLGERACGHRVTGSGCRRPRLRRRLYIHWIVTGIPPAATEIVDGALPQGAQVGPNSGGEAAYLGPCPPAGTGVHHYRFQLSAIGKPLTLPPSTPAQEAVRAITDAAIVDARVVGLFSG